MGPQFSTYQAPGEVLSLNLATRHWTQTEFAEILGRPAQFVSEIIAGKKEITRDSAEQIAAALNSSAEFWLNLQTNYLLQEQRKTSVNQQTLDSVRRRARLNTWAPINLLRKRGHISSTELDGIEREVKELFRIDDLDRDPTEALALAARRTDAATAISPAQRGWVAVAQQQARDTTTATLDIDKLTALAATLTTRAADPSAVKDFARLFAEVGVRLVYVEAFPGSKMDGASFLLDRDSQRPVIALSGRGKRLDKVIFTLLHEVAHVVNGDLGDGAHIHDETTLHTLGDEQAADALAGTWQLPGGLPAAPASIRKPWIDKVAASAGVHPIVVVGRLQKDGVVDWRTPLVKGAPNIDTQLNSWSHPQ